MSKSKTKLLEPPEAPAADAEAEAPVEESPHGEKLSKEAALATFLHMERAATRDLLLQKARLLEKIAMLSKENADQALVIAELEGGRLTRELATLETDYDFLKQNMQMKTIKNKETEQLEYFVSPAPSR
jgi:hypothetical protein